VRKLINALTTRAMLYTQVPGRTVSDVMSCQSLKQLSSKCWQQRLYLRQSPSRLCLWCRSVEVCVVSDRLLLSPCHGLLACSRPPQCRPPISSQKTLQHTNPLTPTVAIMGTAIKHSVPYRVKRHL